MTIGYRAMTFSYLISLSALQCHFQPFRCFFGYEENKVSTEIFLFWLKWEINQVHTTNSYRDDILRFGNISLFFGPKNGTSTELQTLHIFLEIKKTLRVCFAQIWEKNPSSSFNHYKRMMISPLVHLAKLWLIFNGQ